MPSQFTAAQWAWEVARMQDLLANDVPKQDLEAEKQRVWQAGFDCGYGSDYANTLSAAKDTNGG